MRHHFIPQFYQRGFTHDGGGLIWVYEKDRPPRSLSVRKAVGMEDNLYGFTNHNGELDCQSVEAQLSEIDRQGAQAIQKLTRGELLDDVGRQQVCVFASVLWRRTPKHKMEAEAMASKMMPKFFDERDENWLLRKMREHAPSEEVAQRWFSEKQDEFKELREKYLSEVPDFLFPTNVIRDSMFEQVLYNMDWGFFKSTENTEFLTCDNPIAFSKGSGLKDREAVVIFPLSRRLLLQGMWISTFRNTFYQSSDTEVRTFNRYVVQNAHKQVYASKRSGVIEQFVNKRLGEFHKRANPEAHH